jgi:hypothetical protein
VIHHPEGRVSVLGETDLQARVDPLEVRGDRGRLGADEDEPAVAGADDLFDGCGFDARGKPPVIRGVAPPGGRDSSGERRPDAPEKQEVRAPGGVNRK